MNKTEVTEKVLQLSAEQEWNHQYKLPHGIATRKSDIKSPGYNVNKWKRLLPIFSSIINSSFDTCLDVGCSDGYYCIEGAKLLKDTHFTGIDLDPIRIKRANFIKSVFNIDNVEFKHEDLYDLISKDLKFDMVMGLGLLHRVPNLDKCIEDLASLSRKYLIFEFKSIRSEMSTFTDHGGKTKSNSLNGLHKTPSKSYVENKLKDSGFRCIHALHDSSNLNFPRLIIVGERNE